MHARTKLVDLDHWELELAQLKAQYQSAEPYPHILIDNFLFDEIAKSAESEFPDPRSPEWLHYKHYNEKKLAHSSLEAMPELLKRIILELNSDRFCRWLGDLTGIHGLMPDPSLAGGGLHQMERGGFLNMHADFTSHPRHETWARRVNVLIYLNTGWEDSFGGSLELWDRKMTGCVRSIAPLFNRCVIFNTDRDSFHGLPNPLTCPDGMTRKSIALYYFTDDGQKAFTQSTEYRAAPQDSIGRRALILLDKLAVRGYDMAKRRLGLQDSFISRIMRRLGR